MIKSFSHKGLEDYFFDGTKKGILPNHANRITTLGLNLEYEVTYENTKKTTCPSWANIKKSSSRSLIDDDY
jgi:proteic killer suppression protein